MPHASLPHRQTVACSKKQTVAVSFTLFAFSIHTISGRGARAASFVACYRKMSAVNLSDRSLVDHSPQGGDRAAVNDENQAKIDRLQQALPAKRHPAKVASQNTPLQEYVAIFTMLLVFG